MVEVVQTEDAFGPACCRRQIGDGIRGCVRREDRVRPADLVETPEHVLLDLHVFENGLDDEVDVGQILESGCAADAVRDGSHLLRREQLSFEALVQRLLDNAQPACNLVVVEIDEHDLEGFGRHLLGDAAPHVAGPDYSQAFETSVIHAHHPICVS